MLAIHRAVELSWIAFAVGIVTCLALFVCYTLTACSDPGVVFVTSKDQAAEDVEGGTPMLQCARCELPRPKNAVHCYECGVCVEEVSCLEQCLSWVLFLLLTRFALSCGWRQLDHHCPWTGKCIGKKNIKTFYAFLWTLLLHIVYVVITFLVSLAF